MSVEQCKNNMKKIESVHRLNITIATTTTAATTKPQTRTDDSLEEACCVYHSFHHGECYKKNNTAAASSALTSSSSSSSSSIAHPIISPRPSPHPRPPQDEKQPPSSKRKRSGTNKTGLSSTVAGFRGVRKLGEKYQTHLNYTVYLGIFDTGKEAAIAYDQAVHKYGLPVSMLNFPTMQHANDVDGVDGVDEVDEVDDLDTKEPARKKSK